ncbi:MAG: dethiobiotin synthase [bacterium]|nr:dethiobiotin synthase [bacterium]
MGKFIFVAGTDTSAGKTVVTGFLARYFHQQGRSVITQKWIQTGAGSIQEDIQVHQNLMLDGCDNKADIFQKEKRHVSPYILKMPAAPVVAAKKEGVFIDKDKIKNSYFYLKENYEVVIVEGIGGVLVPYVPGEYIIDLAAEAGLSVIIVAANKLGAINHTLLTIEAIKHRKMKIEGIIFNQVDQEEDPDIISSNISAVIESTSEKVFGGIRYSKNFSELYFDFKKLLENQRF